MKNTDTNSSQAIKKKAQRVEIFLFPHSAITMCIHDKSGSQIFVRNHDKHNSKEYLCYAISILCKIGFILQDYMDVNRNESSDLGFLRQ